MPEKLEDRLFRLNCEAYGQKLRIADVIRVMTDEQLETLFSSALECGLQSGEIKPIITNVRFIKRG